MSRTKTTFARRALASVGAAALGLMGVVGLSTAAMAADPPTTGQETGSLTLVKHWEKEGSTPNNPLGETLAGVEFTVTQVLKNGQAINLTNAAGWADAEAVFASTAPTLPTGGYTLATTSTSLSTDANGRVQFTPLTVGVYLVTETGSGNNLIADPADPFWVSIPMPNTNAAGEPTGNGFTYDVTAYPKNGPGDFTATKTVNSGTLGSKEVAVGDPVAFTVSATLPAAQLAYESVTIADTLPDTLTFVSWGEVSLNDEALVAADYSIDPVTHNITLTGPGLVKVNAITQGTPADGETPAVPPAPATITAVINTTVASIPSTGVFENKATVTVNGTPEEPTAKVNVGQLRLKKVSETTNGTSLAGANFSVYATAPDAQGNPTSPVVATGTTLADGTVSWTLWVGNGTTVTKDYWVLETKAPDGHVLPANPWTDPLTVNAGALTEGNHSATIVNMKPTGPELPLTGASGTMLMTIGGIGLVAVAGGLYLATRRKAHQE